MLADREAGHGAQAAARPRLRGRCVQGGSEECAAPAYERHLAHAIRACFEEGIYTLRKPSAIALTSSTSSRRCC